LGAMLFLAVHSSTGTFLILTCRPLIVDTGNKVLYNNYLHDADDSDRRSATLLAELISVRDGLSDISFSDGSVFAYDVCDFFRILRCRNYFYYFICTFFLHNVRIVRSFIINK